MAKAKVGDIAEDLILLAAVGVGAYFLIKYLLPNFGGGISDNNKTVTTATTAAAAADAAATAAKNVTPTLSATAIAGMATAINNDLQVTDFSGNPNPNLSDAVWQVAQCNNAADWFALVAAFGVKNYNTTGSMSLCSFIAAECTSMGLVSALQAAIAWDQAQGNTTDAITQMNNLNGTMQVLGVAQTFNT